MTKNEFMYNAIIMHQEREKEASESGYKYDLVVIIDTMNAPAAKVAEEIAGILQISQNRGLDTFVLVAKHRRLNPENTQSVEAMIKNTFPLVAEAIVVEGEATFAAAYLKGIDAAKDLAPMFIEKDTGAHSIHDLEKFIDALENHDLVFATRFAQGGKNKYPLQRQLVSRGAALFARVTYGSSLSDTSSGYRGYRSRVIKELFEVYPPDRWLSAVYGPFHLVQDEMAAVLSLFFDKYSFVEVPITYGEYKKGKKFSLFYIANALYGGLRIVRKRSEIKKTLAKK